MLNHIEQTLLSSLSIGQAGAKNQAPAAGQTSFFDLIAQMMSQAGANTAESNLLQDWGDLMSGSSSTGAPIQHHHHHHQKTGTNGLTIALNNPLNTTNLLMTAITPGVDSTAAADNSNTGSISGSLLI